AAAFNVSTVAFAGSFTPLFGESNVFRSPDDRSLQIHLNQYTGSGFRSSNLYDHGFFSSKIKLPSPDYTAGIVVAFYLTNGDMFRAHDELDFEFLGNVRGKPWSFQTNMYGNGSTSRGREERYHLWFDPSHELHSYSILWTTKKIIFFVDDVPIREITKKVEMGGDFPAKPMALYATVWDASSWATSGGKYKVNYKYAPFVVEFSDLVLHGCISDPLEEVVGTAPQNSCDDVGDIADIKPKQRAAMNKFRLTYMYYCYCYHDLRYSTPLPECVIDAAEKRLFSESGEVSVQERQRRQRRWKKAA
ncbi:xyloglucan endotransglucosylase/hydrolase 14, partial [Genlisea aurea]